jgi:anthranilate synthase component 1
MLSISSEIKKLKNLTNKIPKEYFVDCCEPDACFRLFAYIKTLHKNSYYFESLALPRHQDRYYTLGFSPYVTIEGTKGKVNLEFLDGRISTIASENPYQFLKENFNLNNSKNWKSNQGGIIGYFCHEAINCFEPSLNLEEDPDFLLYKVGVYLDGFVYDTTTATLSFYQYTDENSNENDSGGNSERVETAKKLYQESKTYEIPSTLKSVDFLGDSETKEEFIQAVEKTREKIANGFSFQSEVGFKSNYNISGDKVAIYQALRKINPSPYMYYVQFGDRELLGASPELLISSKQGSVLTTPTAGTTTRGKTQEEDTTLARNLLNDPKEKAEHNMLVDLHRNDIARVCDAGSVEIADLMYIIKFSHVQHIVSNIVGRLKKGTTHYDVLSCILPGGVVTGAPKIETIKIINENESRPRGPYGGAVGRFSFNNDCDFCLPIRSIFCKGDKCFAQTSAGVVYDSIPEKEYKEVVNKLAAMKQTLTLLGATHN